MDDVKSDGYTGQQNETTAADEFNAASFLVNQILSGKWTITLCIVKSVSGGGIEAPAVVSVKPMVNQVDGQNKATPHGTIFNIPAFRVQGGLGAFITDPAVGDIGLMACASRDISAVKANRAVSNPGSKRSFDPSDGLYLGGFLGATPQRYVQITDNVIKVVFSDAIKVDLSADGITLTAGAAVLNLATDGAITIGGIVWGTHQHAVTTAPGDTGPPIP
jgi:hypothetical protein